MMKMKSKFLFFIVFVISSFFCVNNVHADYRAYVSQPSGASCSLYKGSRGYCFYKDKNLNSLVSSVYFFDNGDEVTVLTGKGTVNTNNKALCSDYYVYANYYFPSKPSTVYTGLFCNAHLKPFEATDELKNKFKDAGFPESYWDGLAKLQTLHPNWTFQAIQTNLDWNTVVNKESAVGTSLIQGDEGYRSTLGGSYDYYTDTFRVLEGSNWYAANSQVVEYYMDPRNFLTDTYIFQFETLKSVPSIQNLDAVKSVLGNNFLSAYASDFITAASVSNVSSVYLASLALQEVGGAGPGGTSVNGKSFIYDSRNSKYSTLRGQTIPGSFYNVYNIGAGTDVVPAQNSIVYARGGVDGTARTYDRPWNSMSLAITGGAKFIGEEYVAVGQDTIYFKKFNVTPVNGNLYSHQYQTNIMAAVTEGNKMYKAYSEQKKLEQPFVFAIPVYNNMPTSTSMPRTGNPNNFLDSLKVDKQSVNNFDGGKTNYTFYVPYSKSNVTIDATSVKNKASIENIGVKQLNVGNNSFNIVVTAKNGSKRTYTLNIIRSQNDTGEPTVNEVVEKLGVKSDGKYFSGISLNTNLDTLVNKVMSINPAASVTVKNRNGKIKNNAIFATGDSVIISSAGETKTFVIVIYGDTNGDGVINALDLLRIQKHILNVSKLGGSDLKAADPSKDGNVNALDLLKVQKHVLGISFIEQ